MNLVRRSVLAGMFATPLSCFLSAKVSAQNSRDLALSFDALLNRVVVEDIASSGRDQRERQANEIAEYADRAIPRRALSDKRISDRAMRLIIAFEVTSPAVYERKYRGAIWPQGGSGVTIGCGYDVGYTTVEWLHEDWGSIDVSKDQIKSLEIACGVKGVAAASLLPKLRNVVIPWKQAEDQFSRYVLPRYVAETLIALPGAADIDIDCLGALVSITYNRGASYSREGDRYKEMRAIRRHLQDGKHQLIADEIRSMKRLWVGQSNMTGLLYRRELEAKLFEEGLKRRAQ